MTNTDNSYYGAYQFDLGTWAGVGDSGLPGNAGPVTQHALGRHGVNTVCVYAMSTAGIAKRLVSCRVVAP